jgi:anti-sigma B factor antagonist
MRTATPSGHRQNAPADAAGMSADSTSPQGQWEGSATVVEDLKVTVVEQRGRLTVAAIIGELDLTGAPEAYVRATSLLGDHPDLIVDLSGVTFCDSTGFNALLRLRRRVMEAEGWLALAAPPAQIGRLLTLIGIDVAFALYGSTAEAVADYEGAGSRRWQRRLSASERTVLDGPLDDTCTRP